MPCRRLPVLLAISAVLFVTCGAQASSIRKPTQDPAAGARET
jgi:hypothetical protein